MVYIYILKLKNNKYYVGKTSRKPLERLSEHFDNSGSGWTRVHNPVKIMEIIPNCDEEDEDKYTIKYMKKYGIDNVRGGSFCQITLSLDTSNTLNRMIRGSSDKCYLCGESGHFIVNCPFKCNDVGEYESSDEYEYVYECDYCSKEFDTEKGAKYHQRFYCKHKTKTKSKSNPQKCHRCGRSNHYASKCYATKHIKGYYL